MSEWISEWISIVRTGKERVGETQLNKNKGTMTISWETQLHENKELYWVMSGNKKFKWFPIFLVF